MKCRRFDNPPLDDEFSVVRRLRHVDEQLLLEIFAKLVDVLVFGTRTVVAASVVLLHVQTDADRERVLARWRRSVGRVTTDRVRVRLGHATECTREAVQQAVDVLQPT